MQVEILKYYEFINMEFTTSQIITFVALLAVMFIGGLCFGYRAGKLDAQRKYNADGDRYKYDG